MPDCAAVAATKRGDWPTPWALAADNANVFRDAIGRKGRGAHRIWLRFRCNDILCPALLLVNGDDIFGAVSRG